MTDKQLEAILLNILAAYREDYNEVNKGKEEIDLDMTISKMLFDPSKMNPKGKRKYIEQYGDESRELYYLRLYKESKSGNGRVLFAGYRPVEDFKKASDARLSLIKEALAHLVIGGIEYAEMLSMMGERQKQKATKDEK